MNKLLRTIFFKETIFYFITSIIESLGLYLSWLVFIVSKAQ